MARLLTIQEFKAQVPYSPTAEAEVLALLDAVCQTFESYTRRIWLRTENLVLTFRSDGDSILFPKLYPIESIAQIQEGDLGSAPETVDVSKYVVDKPLGMIEKLREPWKDQVSVTLTGGYLVADIPSDVKSGICLEVRRRLQRDQGERISQATEAIANSGSTAFVSQEAWHPEFRRVCNRYRKCGV